MNCHCHQNSLKNMPGKSIETQALFQALQSKIIEFPQTYFKAKQQQSFFQTKHFFPPCLLPNNALGLIFRFAACQFPLS